MKEERKLNGWLVFTMVWLIISVINQAITSIPNIDRAIFGGIISDVLNVDSERYHLSLGVYLIFSCAYEFLAFCFFLLLIPILYSKKQSFIRYFTLAVSFILSLQLVFSFVASSLFGVPINKVIQPEFIISIMVGISLILYIQTSEEVQDILVN